MAEWKNTEYPWERREDETPKAYEAFSVYRDMEGKRSVQAVATKLSKSRHLISRWKGQYNWDERCLEYDRELEREELKERKRRRKAARRRNEDTARALREKAEQWLANVDINAMDAKDALRMLELSSKLEAAALLDQPQDREIELRREMFEYQKERDSGANVEYEDLDEVEAAIYGSDQTQEDDPV